MSVVILFHLKNIVLFLVSKTSFQGALGAEGRGPNANISSSLKSEYYPSAFLALYLTLYFVSGAPKPSFVVSMV